MLHPDRQHAEGLDGGVLQRRDRVRGGRRLRHRGHPQAGRVHPAASVGEAPGAGDGGDADGRPGRAVLTGRRTGGRRLGNKDVYILIVFNASAWYQTILRKRTFRSPCTLRESTVCPHVNEKKSRHHGFGGRQ